MFMKLSVIIVTMYRATNDRFVFFLRVKHHSEKLVMLELTNHILPEQA